ENRIGIVQFLVYVQVGIDDQTVERGLVVEIQVPTVVKRVESQVLHKMNSPFEAPAGALAYRYDVFPPHPLPSAVGSVDVQKQETVRFETASKISQAFARVGENVQYAHAQDHMEGAGRYHLVHQVRAPKFDIANLLLGRGAARNFERRFAD